MAAAAAAVHMKRALRALHLIEFNEFYAKYGNMISLIGHHVAVREAIYRARQWKSIEHTYSLARSFNDDSFDRIQNFQINPSIISRSKLAY